MILVAAAIPVVALFQRFRIPSIVGFLLTGVAIGPSGLHLIADTASVSELAEMGVVLLLFAIGLELSLSRVLRLGRVLIQGGTVQVGGTLLAVTAVALAAGESVEQAVLFGALGALSSTAIILKVYSERGTLDTPDGRLVVPIALYQDLAIIPLVLLVGLLGGTGGAVGGAVVKVGGSILLVAVLVLGGRAVIPWVLAQIARVRSRELFTLAIVFLGVAAAYVTQLAGLSLALGAFLAGLVISESEYGAQALSDVVPFRDTLTGIFFASVGMLLDLSFVARQPVLVLGVAVGVIVLKAGIAAGAGLSLRRPLHTSLVAGLGLAQVGEFSFVLATLALPLGLLPPDAYQLFLSASVITMFAAPFVIAAAPGVATTICRVARQPEPVFSEEEDEDVHALRDHVVIVGYGVNGRNLARVLDGAGVPYVILEQNPDTVTAARAELQPILFGDATRPAVLERVHLERARAIVFAISSPADEVRGVAAARAANPTVHIIVRTRYVRAMQDLLDAGANEVVPEEFETSLEIFSRVLRHFEVASNVIAREVEGARVELYGMALGRAAGPSQLEALAHLGVHHGLEMIAVEPGAEAVDGHPVSLDLRRRTGATVIAVVRDGQALYTPNPEFRFRPGDTVVLAGDDEALVSARRRFVAAAPGEAS